MPDGMYERDVLAWAEHQAALLRRLAAGETPNEAVDWANVIEELQDVGRSELHGCESLLTQAMVHLIKLHIHAGSRHDGRWHQEVARFLNQARKYYSPSMRQRLFMDELYADALRELRKQIASQVANLPVTSPYTLDELITPDFDTDALLAKFQT